MSITIVKADGATEAFNENKLRRSLRRSGASKDEIAHVIEHIAPELHDGIRTHEIYRHAFSLLRDIEVPIAARYSLRRALFNLGPTGFPFEDFLAKLFATEGYTTKTRTVLSGSCADHELDVVCFNQTHSFVAEAKFHARPGIKSDLQVALYSYARLLDLKGKSICSEDHCGITELWIITNTKFTSAAERYATCVGLTLLSWDFPKNNNLHDRIQKSGLYPITVLQSISNAQKQTLIKHGVIVCSELTQNPAMLRHLKLSTKKIEAVLSEARQLCHPHQKLV